MMVSRRACLHRLGTGVLALGVAGGPLAAATLVGCAAPATPLTIAWHPWPGYAPLQLAHSQGWWEGLPLQRLATGSASESLAQLRAGRAQAAALTLDEVLTAHASGLALRVVAVFDLSEGADVVLARPERSTPPSWRGARLGHEAGAVGTLMATAWLDAAGLQPEDVQMVHIPFDQHEAAWARDEVDVLVTFEPVATRLQQRGAVRIFDSSLLPADTAIVHVLAVHPRALDTHPAAGYALLRHIFAAQRHLHTLPVDSAYRLSPWLGLPRETVLASFRGLRLTDWADNRAWLVGAQPRLPAAAAALARVMHANAQLPSADAPVSLSAADWLPTDAPTVHLEAGA